MTPLFFCTAAQDQKRLGMALLCLERWRQEKVQIALVRPSDDVHWMGKWKEETTVVPGPLSEFQKMRRIAPLGMLSEEDDFYILADDDCLLPDDFDLDAFLNVLRLHPEFAIASPMPLNACINRWTPEDFKPYEDKHIREHVSVGGIRACRKVNIEWPDYREGGYDADHCEAIREAGLRVGHTTKHGMIHLGERHWILPHS